MNRSIGVVELNHCVIYFVVHVIQFVLCTKVKNHLAFMLYYFIDTIFLFRDLLAVRIGLTFDVRSGFKYVVLSY